ncbi:MAG: RagB/SusD family nutrient uptake outer membrane protein, partial [Bacteroidales bacterium]|nr:RagB/SusD family nutrient uptake outer membrane protein [Bacteroidales bacterium]
MKKIKYILLLIVPLTIFSCSKDFLDRKPEDAYVVDNFYVSAENLRVATGALYNIPWFDFNDKASFCIGDGSAGNFLSNDGAMYQFYQFSVTSTNSRLNEAWRSLYVVVGQANSLIQGITEKADASISEEDKNAAIAEAKFMRAVAYQYLGILWGPVPIIEDNSKHILDPKVPRHKLADVFQFVINDLTFAAENLPAADVPGRVTSWSAKAMLARTYLYRAGLGGSKNQADIDQAKTLAEDVIKNSGLTLMDKYEDLFKLENNNNPESLFALQWVVDAQNWGSQNTHQAYFAAEGKLT